MSFIKPAGRRVTAREAFGARPASVKDWPKGTVAIHVRHVHVWVDGRASSYFPTLHFAREGIATDSRDYFVVNEMPGGQRGTLEDYNDFAARLAHAIGRGML